MILDLEALKNTVMKYSLKITGDPWDADDLTQDVILKLVIAFQKNSDRQLTNAFIYRIAINTWKDKLKKNNQTIHVISSDPYIGRIPDDHSTREMLEEISAVLPPRSVSKAIGSFRSSHPGCNWSNSVQAEVVVNYP